MKPRHESQGVARVGAGVPVILPEARHEIWTLNPEGDLEGCYFDLPTPAYGVAPPLNWVQKAALETWQLWNAWYTAPQTQPIYRGGQLLGFGQDKQPTSEPRIRGPFRIPDYDELDMARYYMTCRWRRCSPLIVSLDEAALYAETEAPDDEEMFEVFFRNLHSLNADPNFEREARKHARELSAIAAREEELHQRLAWRLAHLGGQN